MSEKSKNTSAAEQQAPADAVYAELPEPTASIGIDDAWHEPAMRDFADRTHALRMEQAAPKAAPVELSDAEIDAFLDSPGGIEWVIADKRERYRLLVRAVLAKWAAPQQEAQEPAFVGVSLRTAIAKAVYQQMRVKFKYRLCAWTALDADEQQRIVDSIRGLYTAPQPAPAPLSDDVVRDAARYEYIRDCTMGERSRLEHYSGPALDVVIDAARKQGVNHD